MQTISKARFIALAGFGILHLSSLSAAAGPADYLEGMDAYSRHDYAVAKQHFARMVHDAPEDALGHYYLANTLVFMKDLTGATREYQTAIENADSDDVKTDCQTALKALKKSGVKGAAAALEKTASINGLPGGLSGRLTPPAVLPGTAAARTSTGIAPGSGPDTANTLKLGETRPTPENMSLLQKQIEDRKQQAAMEMERQQKALLEEAKQRANRIKAEHTADPSMLYRRGGRYFADQLKREGNDQANAVLQQANRQAADCKKYAAEKKAVLDDVANSLDSQMNQTGGPSKIHLKREGTNLNVRNYEFSH